MWQLLPAGAYWCGQYYASGVDSLAEPLLVDPSGELSDQHWSHSLEAELLMNTQEFDLYHPPLPAETF